LGDTYNGSGKGAGGSNPETSSKQLSNKGSRFKFENKFDKICENCGKQFKGYAFQSYCCGACAGVDNTKRKDKGILPNKCLLMIPERFAIKMIDSGWILRNQIIWHKPNQMPSSAKDRFTVDFEKIFFFVKQQKYYFEQQVEKSLTQEDRPFGIIRDREYDYDSKQAVIQKRKRPNGVSVEQSKKLGNISNCGVNEYRNMRTVWSINTDPTSEAHFATYPQKLVQRMILAGCPENGIVLDPFFGSGTTGIYARKVNRNYIGIELNSEYVKIANKRLRDELGMFA
jgi:site-specific DNA-methyltransferase (adenine-specific)